MPKPILSLKALRALHIVFENQNFSIAAHKLNVTPAAVQQLVRGLEFNIGKSLVKRNGRELVLTDLAKSVRNDLDKGFQLIEHVSNNLSHKLFDKQLKISVEPTFAMLWLLKNLEDFRHHYPELTILVDVSNRIVDLNKGEADIAIRYNAKISHGLSIKRLMEDQFIAVCSPAIIESKAKIKTPLNLKNYPLIHFDWPQEKRFTPDWPSWFEQLGYPDIKGGSSIHFNDYIMTIQAAIAGQGFCITSQPLIQDTIDAGLLIAPFPETLKLGFGYDLVIPKSSQKQENISTFVNWIEHKSQASIQ